MAAAVVAVVVDDLLRKLSQGMELGPQWGVEAQLREIHGLSSSIQWCLPQAESKFPFSFELQDMVRKLKEAVYDTEDLLEELSLEEPLRLQDGKLRRLFRHVERCLFGRRMRRELGAIAGRLRDTTDPLIGILRSIHVQVVPEARETPFVGRVKEKGEMIRFLLDGCTSSAVVYGGRGCGKTAFVREVMKNKRVSGYFDVKIWVNVSAPFDSNRVAKEMIGSLRREEEDVEDEGEVFGWEQSLHLLPRLLDDSKRHLFVLDNVSVRDWDSEGWLSFRRLMEGGVVAGGSKIILVTDSLTWEWDNPKPGTFVHDLHIEGMDREDAMVLLRETAFHGRELYQILFLPILIDIVEGNPRMIKGVGGYLSLQPPPLPVQNIVSSSHQSDLSLRGGYPYADLTSPVVKRYHNLSTRIQQCFSLCYLFPRGHSINTRTLAQLWISLGFIHNNDHDGDQGLQPLEDIAHGYLDVLLREELFRVKDSDILGKVKSVALHPDAQELVPSTAGWECLVYHNYILMHSHARRYARHRSTIDYTLDREYPYDKMRTFLHFEEDRTHLRVLYRHLITTLNHKGNRLRVLDLHDVKAYVLPEGVWKLKHLRYLDLSGNTMLQMLPPAIIGLLNLQTLKLSGCSSLKELPNDMSNLSALRHLHIDGCWKLALIPRGLCDLKCLNILTDFILPPDDSSNYVDYAGLTDLCKLNDLRGSLKIRNLGCYDEELTDEGLEELLDRKSYLESVELRFMNLPTDTSLLEKLKPHRNLKRLIIHGYGGSEFPKWMVRLSTHLPNLVEIALIGCENCMDLPLIGHLPLLKKLTIQGLPDLEHIDSGSRQSLPEDAEGAQPFGKLSSLCIKDCPKLNSLPIIPRLLVLTLVNVSEELFMHPCQLPNLKTLRLENIEHLDNLPEEWIRGLTSLKELHIGSCHSLTSFMPGIGHLETLKSFTIWNCKALDLSTDEQGNIVTEPQGLKSLRRLTIYKASKMEHLPECLSHVATLRFLCIRSCPRLVAVPEWICSLHSLQLLELIHCPGLASLPEGIHQFNNSYPKKLTVVGCPAMESQIRRGETTIRGRGLSHRL